MVYKLTCIFLLYTPIPFLFLPFSTSFFSQRRLAVESESEKKWVRMRGGGGVVLGGLFSYLQVFISNPFIINLICVTITLHHILHKLLDATNTITLTLCIHLKHSPYVYISCTQANTSCIHLKHTS